MAKAIYDQKITRSTDWGGDESTGGAPVSGARVQEYIKGEITALEHAIDNIPLPVVDESLDPDSTNAVANSAVASELARIDQATVSDIEADVDEDGGIVTLSLLNRDGSAVSSCEIPLLGGGGDGSSDATKLILTPAVSLKTVKAGEPVTLSFPFDIVYAAGEDQGVSTGIHADLEVTVMCGPTTLYHNLRSSAAAGTYTHDIGPYLAPGTCDIYVKASWTGPDGTPRSKQRYLSVKVVALGLTTDFPLTAMLDSGGYGNETAEIPYKISGSGVKTVTLYIDGQEKESHTVTATNPSTQRFLVPMGSMSAGMHSAQIVATMSADARTLKSNSLYITLLKSGAQKAVALVLSNPDGTIVTGGNPQLPAGAFEPVDILYGVYDAASPSASATISEDGAPVSSLSLPRQAQTYSTRYTTPGAHSITIACGSASLTIGVNVAAGDISIAEADYGRVLRLRARGRSNSEAPATRAIWADGDTATTFTGVDWAASGWTGEALRLINGAKATVNIRPFADDSAATGVKADGRTIEATLRISRVNDYTKPIVSCMEGGKGFRIQGDEIAYLTGETTEYPDEDDPTVTHTREVKLSTNYVAGDMIKVTFVIEKAAVRPVMHLYVDGNRCGADKYSTEMSFLQAAPAGLTFDSDAADIEIESVRYYTRALSDDEVLANHIADQTDTTRMIELYRQNDVLDQEGAVALEKLLAQGKGALLIIRPGLLDDVYATNNKKTDFAAALRYYPPAALGVPGFSVDNCYIRIQGTSSTKYPSKNLRLYLGKGPAGKPALMVGGEPASKYRLRPGAVPMDLFTAKSDYSDSSMSLNTGGARLFTSVFKELGLLTPPQQWQHEHGGTISVRASIDGVPIDVFAAESEDSTPVYYGQYNLNNEKSKSGPLFGMEGIEGYTPACPIALESLNNTQPLCLFQVPGDVDAALSSGFDKAFEFNYPEDTFWSPSSISDSAKETLASSPQQTAIRGLFSFIKACVPAGADPSDISTFVSAKFAAEAPEHFDVDYLLTYYLWTEFFVSVDQRAKNILWRTWDGIKWYPTYYDGDTQRGKRNDSFMAYGPDTERDTWDITAAKYAFEGHDSWLWCLCLANLYPRLVACAAALRQTLDAQRALDMLVGEQSGNWCDRVFNRSGELKYITPAVSTVYGRTWPFIYALQGADRQHSEWFVRQRWSLMDAKYGIGDYTSDAIQCYISRSASDAASVLKVTGARTYAYGYGTQNTPNMATTGLVAAGEEASLSITGAFTMNDPVWIYGASRIRKIDASAMASIIQRGFDISKCTALEELDLQVPAGAQPSISWWIAGAALCPLLRKLNLRGQTQASTESGTHVLSLGYNTRLEWLDARSTAVTSVSLAPGAVVSHLRLPATLTSLRLESLPALQGDGAADDDAFSIASMEDISSLTITGCPGVDSLALVTRWLSEKTTANSGCSLTADIDWELDDPGIIASLASMGQLTLTGTIRLGAITMAQREAIIAVLGPGCFSPSAPLHVDCIGTIIMDTESNPRLTALMHARGMAAHAGYMTMEEAAAVTDEQFDTGRYDSQNWIGDGDASGLTSLDELRYFTSITRLPNGFNVKPAVRITIPAGVTELGTGALNLSVNMCHLTMLPMSAPPLNSDTFHLAGVDKWDPKYLYIPRGATGYDAYTAKLPSYTVVYID